MIALIDRMLNRVTMYRLVLYVLMFLIGVATILSFGGVLSYDPFAILFSVGFLITVCWATNRLLAWSFGVAPASDSTYITALILALIITPIEGYGDLWFLGWAGAMAMASKYLLAIDRKHLFNPAAAAVAITYLTVNQSASWWVGNPMLLPFVLVECVLIAGGVGITPFRSMIKHLLDTGQRRPITLLYSNRAARDIVYRDVFDRAHEELGITTIYTVTDKSKAPANWKGRVGRITPQLIQAEIPDYQHCTFYLSGPPGMVDSFKETLRELHVRSSHVRTDFFSGLS